MLFPTLWEHGESKVGGGQRSPPPRSPMKANTGKNRSCERTPLGEEQLGERVSRRRRLPGSFHWQEQSIDSEEVSIRPFYASRLCIRLVSDTGASKNVLRTVIRVTEFTRGEKSPTTTSLFPYSTVPFPPISPSHPLAFRAEQRPPLHFLIKAFLLPWAGWLAFSKACFGATFDSIEMATDSV